jgi:murein DD-endopeptidase MepM/ murein hydrolase activator NlpD
MNAKNHLTSVRLRLASLVLILATLGCGLTGQPVATPPAAELAAPSPTSVPPEATSTSPAQAAPTEEPTAAPPAEAPPTEAPSAVPPAEPPPAEQPPAEEPAAAEPQFVYGPCEEAACLSDGSYFLRRPIGPGGRDKIVSSARFGEYNRVTKSANHWVSFLNSTGTPVLAAAPGVVVVAGDDLAFPYGPYKGLYGNLVILQHELPGLEQPVFTLYGHLSEVGVFKKERVKAGQEIGKVGMSGDVSGSTLAFEVRWGENSYQAARNPELWLEPLQDASGDPYGAFAGRIIAANGDPLTVPSITVEQLAGPGLPVADTFYLHTYAESAISGKPPWGENFAAGDLLPGEYQISFLWQNVMQQQVIEILPGDLTLVTFRLP